LGKHLVEFRCFLGSQIFNRAEVKLMNERIGFLQNILLKVATKARPGGAGLSCPSRRFLNNSPVAGLLSRSLNELDPDQSMDSNLA
jgi:hypothetical protein